MEQHSEDPEEKKKWVSDLKEALEKYKKEAKDDMEKDRMICQVPDRTDVSTRAPSSFPKRSPRTSEGRSRSSSRNSSDRRNDEKKDRGSKHGIV